jgi:hypothetical protein
MRKALSESKANTNWAIPNEPWLRATTEFVDDVLDPQRGAEFWKTFVPFAEELAWRGALFSLAQAALKLTCPGVPDVYQGCDMWDFSLVDPDNRRPVDYEVRAEALRGLDSVGLPGLLKTWRDGRIKLHVTRCLLTRRLIALSFSCASTKAKACWSWSQSASGLRRISPRSGRGVILFCRKTLQRCGRVCSTPSRSRRMGTGWNCLKSWPLFRSRCCGVANDR